MNLQENIQRIKKVMGLLTEEEKPYENKPIILIGPQGTGKSTTAKVLSKKLGIPLIETDMLMIDKKYEELCKNEPGVEIEIKRVNGGISYTSNKQYEFCVMNKIFDDYGNQKVVLDVGGSHAQWDKNLSEPIMKLFNSTPNIFIFNVSENEDETYEFLKKRREGRGEKILPEKELRFKKIINDLRNFYRGKQEISIINPDKTEKTTDEMVDEIITKLT
jgi:shikimate kinase